jgi:uncharacterized protein (DUF983 family)
MPERRRSLLSAILRMRCPKCREGRIFGSNGRTNRSCPICGLSFNREEGYFIGAMYFSYFLAVAFLVGFYVIGRLLLPGWSSEWVAGAAVLLFIPFTPLVTRYSRVLWIHYDRWAWPGADFLGPPT